jgi:hypothetical protein
MVDQADEVTAKLQDLICEEKLLYPFSESNPAVVQMNGESKTRPTPPCWEIA